MSNLSTLQTLVNWANAGVIISLALSFVFGATSILLGGKLGKLKDAQAETAQRNLELAVSTQQERAANAEKQLALVRKRQDPRIFNATLAPLLDALKHKPPGTAEILYEEGDGEVFDFAGMLERCLRSNGWEVTPARPIGNTVNGVYVEAGFSDLNSWRATMRLGAAATGVSIIMNPKMAATVETNPEYMAPFDTLVGAFTASGIQFNPIPVQPDPLIPDGLFRIVVASR